MKRALLLVALLGCGSAALPFEGHWTGTLLRSFECADMGGSLADVSADWTVTRSENAIAIATPEADCPTLSAEVLPGSEDEARMGVTRCETTRPAVPDGGAIVDPVTNTRTWTDGRLRLRQAGRELLVDMWEHDEGAVGQLDGGVPYVCDGLSFGALALEGG